MIKAYEDLIAVCDDISKEWKKYDDDCGAFIDIVKSKTKGLDLSYFGELSNILKILENPNVAALQATSTFSDLYVQIFNNGRFHVEILNWWRSDINIHDHDFSGVQFQLKGSSLNVVYKFCDEQRTAKLARGPIDVVRAELWQAGDQSYVYPGDIEPHIVFHLNIPTVSLLIRTRATPEYGPQRNYFPPGLAGSYGIANPIFRKRLHAIKLLSIAKDTKTFHESFFRLMDFQSPHENLFTLIKLGDVLFQSRNANLLSEFSKRGDVEQAIVTSVVFRRASDFLSNRIKNQLDLSFDEQMALSILAASHDPESLSKIRQSLRSTGVMKDFDKHIFTISEHLSDDLKKSFNQILKLLRYSTSSYDSISA